MVPKIDELLKTGAQTRAWSQRLRETCHRLHNESAETIRAAKEAVERSRRLRDAVVPPPAP